MPTFIDAIVRESLSTMLGPDTWEEIVAFTLSGSVVVTETRNSYTYTERATGTEIVLSGSGGAIDSLSITGISYVNGDRQRVETLDMTFGGEDLTLDSVANAFNRYMNNPSRDPLASFDGIAATFTFDDPVGPGRANTYYEISGSSEDDIFNLADALNLVYGSTGDDIIRGGDHIDQVAFFFEDGRITGSRATNNGVEITLSDGSVQRLSSVEIFSGTIRNDNLRAGVSDDNSAIFGNVGNDRIGGRGGDDVLDGETGDDLLWGGDGHDILIGGSGNDVLRGGAGRDWLFAGDGGLGAAGSETDRLIGGADDDALKGNGGADVLRGGRGADDLEGGLGRDNLVGGAGADRLEGGAGADRLTGNTGADTFVFDRGFGRDVITDFRDGVDLLDFSGHSAISGVDDLGIAQVGLHTVITDGVGGRIILRGVEANDLQEDDFLF